MWDFISYKTSTKEEDNISYYHKCLKSLYYLNKWVLKMNVNKWVLKMNNYLFLSKCSVKSVTKLAPGKNS
jgi:hypothetical protein